MSDIVSIPYMAAHRARHLGRALLVLISLILSACLISCTSPEAVAKFASDAAKSLGQGTVIFEDIPASVVRRDCDANVENRDFDFKPSDEACVINAVEQGNLSDAKKERDDVIAVQQVLIDYFIAIQQLADFGKATSGSGKSQDDASKGGSAASSLKSSGKLSSSDEVKAVTSLGQIVVRAFSAGYQNRQLARDMKDGDTAVAAITGALKHIVSDDYMFNPKSNNASFLNLEATRMREEFKSADGGRLLLRVSWTDRSNKLLARNSSAQSYVDALEKIRAGHQKLATASGQLKAQGLAADLEPYISSLESLISQIQKVF